MGKEQPKRPKDANQLAKLIVDMSTGERPKDQDKMTSPNQMDENSDYILKFIAMHPDLNMPIHMASDKFNGYEVDEIINSLVESGHLYFDNNKYLNDAMVRRAVLTKKGERYVKYLNK
jgi:hypothetical protein